MATPALQGNIALLAIMGVVGRKQARAAPMAKKVQAIKRHVLTCLLGLVPTTLITAVSVHNTQPVGALTDRAAQDGWAAQGRGHLHWPNDNTGSTGPSPGCPCHDPRHRREKGQADALAQ